MILEEKTRFYVKTKREKIKKKNKKNRLGWELKAWDEQKWLQKRGSNSRKTFFRRSTREPPQNGAGVRESRFRPKLEQK